MNPETILIIIFVVMCIIVFSLLIIRFYLQWKILKAIQEIPDEKKPFGQYSKNTRAVIVLVLIALSTFIIYRRYERKNEIREIRKEQGVRARQEMYQRQHPPNDILNYHFSNNNLVYNETFVLSVPELPTNFCDNGTKVIWSPESVTPDARYLNAYASCFIVTPDAWSEVENSTRKHIVIDLQEKVVLK